MFLFVIVNFLIRRCGGVGALKQPQSEPSVRSASLGAGSSGFVKTCQSEASRASPSLSAASSGANGGGDGGAAAGTGLDEPAGAPVRRPSRCFTEGPAGNNSTGAQYTAFPGRAGLFGPSRSTFIRVVLLLFPNFCSVNTHSTHSHT